MAKITSDGKYLIVACGDAIKVDYIKKIYVWVQGFGPRQKFLVKADVDGGVKGDEAVIVDIFDDKQEAKDLILKLTE